MRRVTATFNKQNDTYNSNEIVSHQQSTGATEGPGRIAGTLAGELSPGTYALEFAALLPQGLRRGLHRDHRRLADHRRFRPDLHGDARPAPI
jgi:hypothetical protein